MGLEIGCRLKKRSEKCPYQAIKEVEDHIERTKKILYYIEEKTKTLEKALKKADIKKLYELNKEYHDGFSWQTDSLLEVPLAIKQIKDAKAEDKGDCPYTVQTCEDVLYLKTSRVHFLRKKITQAISFYNELIMILNEVLKCHRYHQEEESFFSYQASSRPCLIYSCMKEYKPNEAQEYGLELFYFDERNMEVIHHRIKCHYNPHCSILKETCLGTGNETYKLVEVYLPHEISKMLQMQVLQGTQSWIKYINHLYGRRFGKIQGSYVMLCHYPQGEQMKLITNLKHMGYRAIGRMNESGSFEEKSILIHLGHSLEGGYA